MRMNPSRGEPASRLLAHVTEEKLERLLQENADEPHARAIARALKRRHPATTEDLRQRVGAAVEEAEPRAGRSGVDASIRRTFQALRIAVNDEFSALDGLLRALPICLAPGGRVVILSFHSGEDRRVKKAFEAGFSDGIYSAIAGDVVRPSAGEVRENPRASSARLRWAVRK
jgi:16S rRNA (cytosine1402-N4)-methyltransferase